MKPTGTPHSSLLLRFVMPTRTGVDHTGHDTGVGRRRDRKGLWQVWRKADRIIKHLIVNRHAAGVHIACLKKRQKQRITFQILENDWHLCAWTRGGCRTKGEDSLPIAPFQIHFSSLSHSLSLSPLCSRLCLSGRSLADPDKRALAVMEGEQRSLLSEGGDGGGRAEGWSGVRVGQALSKLWLSFVVSGLAPDLTSLSPYFPVSIFTPSFSVSQRQVMRKRKNGECAFASFTLYSPL